MQGSARALRVVAPPSSPLDELDDLRGRVHGELLQLVKALVSDGRRYADAYADWLHHSGGNGTGPLRPPNLHHKAAAAIREIVLDEAALGRVARRPR